MEAEEETEETEAVEGVELPELQDKVETPGKNNIPYKIKRRREKKMIKFKLGTVLKDTVTDFEGIAIARVVYLNGCVRYEIQPRKLKDGNRIESVWIDETQLITKEEGAGLRGKGYPGGPGNIPSAISHP